MLCVVPYVLYLTSCIPYDVVSYDVVRYVGIDMLCQICIYLICRSAGFDLAVYK